MGRIRFRDIKQRFENRRKSLSRLVLGSPIEDPVNAFGTSSYNLLEGLAVLPSHSLAANEERSNEGAAFDTIVVESSDGKLYHSGEFTVAFEKWNSLRLGDASNDEKDNQNDHESNSVLSLVMKIQRPDGIGEAWFQLYDAEEKIQDLDQKMTDSWENDLKPFLKEGANPVVFCCLRKIVQNAKATTIVQYARASIWKWKITDKVAISDIDGTITKSNARGVLGTILTDQYEKVCHDGICHFLSKLAVSQPQIDQEDISSVASPPTTRIVYLTSRPIHLANKTKSFLSGLSQPQNDNESIIHGLPQGPLLGFGGNLAKVLSMEVLSKTAQAFKAGELEKHIAGPFRRARFAEGQSDQNESVFVAAFGNNFNDVQAYHKIGVDLDRIFVIDKNSHIATFQKTNDSTTTNEEGFLPHSWYIDRLSTNLEDGYSNEKLYELLGIDLDWWLNFDSQVNSISKLGVDEH